MTPGELRARLRPFATNDRDRDCGVRACATGDDGPQVVVKRTAEGAAASFKGIMLCGHIWSCPVCSRVLRAKRAARVEAAVKGLGGTWMLLTLTHAHRDAAGDPLKPRLQGMMRALRRFKQGGRFQRLWSERVSASIRTSEMTVGFPNGWHPHIHMLIRSKPWPVDDRRELFQRWSSAIVAELGASAAPSVRRGVDLTACFDSSAAPSLYLTKMGLELTGQGKHGRNGRWSPVDLAQRAVAGEKLAAALWREYCVATKGHQAIRLDDRASTAADAWLEAQKSDHEMGGESSVPVEVRLDMLAMQKLRNGERKHPTLLDDLLRDCEQSASPETTVREWIRYSSGWRYTTVSERDACDDGADAEARAGASAGASVVRVP